MATNLTCMRSVLLRRTAAIKPNSTSFSARVNICAFKSSQWSAHRSATFHGRSGHNVTTRATNGEGSVDRPEVELVTPDITKEPLEMPPAKLVVLGGNGFVGSAVCKEAVSRGLSVISVNRSGPPETNSAWSKEVQWIMADVFNEVSWADTLPGAAAVISCIGGFAPSAADMERICGDATIAGVEAAAAAGVPRFVFVSVHDYNIPDVVKEKSGYFSGKKRAEEAVLSKFPVGGCVLRPGFIYGDRRIPELGVTVPLGLVGEPVQRMLALDQFKDLKKAVEFLPGSDLALKTPVSVQSVASCAIKCALGESLAPGIVTVEDIALSA